MANATIERQRGQRTEHAPRTESGQTVEPDEIVEPESEDLENEADETAKSVATMFDEAEKLIAGPPAAPVSIGKASRILSGVRDQRHGIVEQRKGIARLDDNGEMVNQTELWRCQCGAKFQGKDPEATRKLALRHLQRYDPEVPKSLE